MPYFGPNQWARILSTNMVVHKDKSLAERRLVEKEVTETANILLNEFYAKSCRLKARMSPLRTTETQVPLKKFISEMPVKEPISEISLKKPILLGLLIVILLACFV